MPVDRPRSPRRPPALARQAARDAASRQESISPWPSAARTRTRSAEGAAPERARQPARTPTARPRGRRLREQERAEPLVQQSQPNRVGLVGQRDRLAASARRPARRHPRSTRPRLPARARQRDRDPRPRLGVVDLRPELQRALEVPKRLRRPGHSLRVPCRVDRRPQRLDRPPGRRPVVCQLGRDRACGETGLVYQGAGEAA